MGNARLTGGPEDGADLDVFFPFPEEIRRGHEGQTLVYAHDGVGDDGKVVYRHTGADGPVPSATGSEPAPEPVEGPGE